MFVETDEEPDGFAGHVRHRRVDLHRRCPASVLQFRVRYAIMQEASVVMQRLSYPTEAVLTIKITRNRIVLSFKDSPQKPLRR